ncbi:MAG: polysaccharide biosynthesis protein GumN [Caulobacteraceae bacterium]|nr:polysaccharide biosynthesis protein GumN [Caulobacteraceae bacterium]
MQLKDKGALAAVLLAAVAMTGATAPAAPPPAGDAFAGQIPDLVSALVVQAVTPGPAWWKVSRGDATVWILGTPPYGTGGGWDQKPLMRRLGGANAFILPPALETQPWIDTPDARSLISGSAQGYDGMGAPKVSDLPADIRLRLAAADLDLRVERTSNTASLIYASRWLGIGMLRSAGLSVTALHDQLSADGAVAGVRRITLPLDTAPAVAAYIAGPAQPKLDCLLATLAQAESGASPLGDAYRAWARGDVPRAMANVGCVAVKGALYRQEVEVLVPLIDAALNTPGKTVVAVELVPLLMKDGLVQRLQAAGYEVIEPDAVQELNTAG